MILPGFSKMMVVTGGFDPTTPVGTFIEGGYFAGVILDNGKRYAIIVAPKASGETYNIRWQASGYSNGPVEAQTLTNGAAATASVVALGSAVQFPAAHWANNLVINGYDDWYLPARDEFALVYRNLKPSAEANYVATREKATVTYNRDGNTDDTSADGVGVNRHSVPASTAHTTSAPAQTSVSVFRDGFSEALIASNVRYWTSTDAGSGTAAWYQTIGSFPGFQSMDHKNSQNHARAIRRVAI